MLCLQIPNIIWARNQPAGYDPSGEPKVLRLIEGIGQVLCTATILLFANTMPSRVAAASSTPWTPWNPWIGWFFAAILLMVIYEYFWVRYFTGRRTLHDFYRPLLGVPAPGATLPVVAFLLLGIEGGCGR